MTLTWSWGRFVRGLIWAESVVAVSAVVGIWVALGFAAVVSAVSAFVFGWDFIAWRRIP